MLRAAHPHPAQALSAEAADCLAFSNPPPAVAKSYGGQAGGNRIRHTVASAFDKKLRRRQSKDKDTIIKVLVNLINRGNI